MGSAPSLPAPAKSLLLVAHDAGGAELLAAWARKQGLHGCACVAEGPARRVFTAAFVRLLDSSAALSNLADFRCVLTGTSWSSDLEKQFIKRAGALGVRTIAYLDHWTDYRERFMLEDRLLLPTEIWVADEFAEVIARTAFPGHAVRVAGNWYLDEIAAQVKARKAAAPARGRKARALFVSEPLAEAAARKYGDSRYHGYTELEALTAFLAHARGPWARELGAIRIRRHPSEPQGKFAPFVDARPPVPISECGGAPLVEDCA